MHEKWALATVLLREAAGNVNDVQQRAEQVTVAVRPSCSTRRLLRTFAESPSPDLPMWPGLQRIPGTSVVSFRSCISSVNFGVDRKCPFRLDVQDIEIGVRIVRWRIHPLGLVQAGDPFAEAAVFDGEIFIGTKCCRPDLPHVKANVNK